jgi:hypothetical protein
MNTEQHAKFGIETICGHGTLIESIRSEPSARNFAMEVSGHAAGPAALRQSPDITLRQRLVKPQFPEYAGSALRHLRPGEDEELLEVPAQRLQGWRK